MVEPSNTVQNEESKLKDRILNEMITEYKNALERNFEIAKGLLKITPEGKVDILFKSKLGGKEQILLYLIGKHYAKEARLCETENVSNKELMEELGIPSGSVLPWTKYLRDSGKIKQIEQGVHSIPINLIEKTLIELDEKIKSK
jgi:hypothetical protein